MALTAALLVLVLAATSLAIPASQPEREDPITPGWPCPIPAAIAPCICFQDTEYNLHMNCSKAKSDSQLTDIFTAVFPFPDFYELKIIHDPEDMTNAIDEISANTFGHLTFERIIITGTKLTEIIDEAFADSHQTLKYLDISNNDLESFPFESLPLYMNLQTFIIDDNHFPVLYDLESESLEVFSANRNPGMLMESNEHFTRVPSLRQLYLSGIGLRELRTDLFNNLTMLQVIDFSRNELMALEQDAVRVQGNTLSLVNFDYNQIYFVRHDAFMGLKSDARLSMANNKLKLLQEEHWRHIFEQITYRESIDLRGNELLCGCEIDWLFMQHEKQFLCRLTDTTLCLSSEQVIFLDVTIYCDQCADSMTDCPEQIDCAAPVPFLLR